MQHKMADSPKNRLKPERPFSDVVVDYCGPFKLTLSRNRGVKSTKSYIAIFICFETRAIHLEIVSSLEAITYIAAFDRLISGGGPIQKLYSDNATNFKGADSEIRELFQRYCDLCKSQGNRVVNDPT